MYNVDFVLLLVSVTYHNIYCSYVLTYLLTLFFSTMMMFNLMPAIFSCKSKRYTGEPVEINK